MAETSGRLLKLLSLLQTPREWPGPELARRLEVSTRTVRNDVERLRSLGYPVEATRGAIGGYRLAAGKAMPPLLLDDDEAVAVAVSLRTAAGGAVDGIEETSLRALTKLQQVLPTRLARRVDAVQSYTVRGGGPPRGPRVDSNLLATLAAAAREREIVRFAYADHQGTATERRVEPYRLVNWGRRWYLVAYDLERGDWRNFRVDRIAGARSVGHRFALRPLPDEDVAAYVSRGARSVQMQFRATVLVHRPAEEVAARMGGWHDGSVEVVAKDCARVHTGAHTADDLARWLVFLDAEFEVVDSPELSDAVRRLAERCSRAAG